VSLRRQEEKASGTAKAALQAWYKSHVKPSCGKKNKRRRRYVVFDFLRRRLSTAQKPRNAFFFCFYAVKITTTLPGLCEAQAWLRSSSSTIKGISKKARVPCTDFNSPCMQGTRAKHKIITLLPLQKKQTAFQTGLLLPLQKKHKEGLRAS